MSREFDGRVCGPRNTTIRPSAFGSGYRGGVTPDQVQMFVDIARHSRISFAERKARGEKFYKILRRAR